MANRETITQLFNDYLNFIKTGKELAEAEIKELQEQGGIIIGLLTDTAIANIMSYHEKSGGEFFVENFEMFELPETADESSIDPIQNLSEHQIYLELISTNNLHFNRFHAGASIDELIRLTKNQFYKPTAYKRVTEDKRLIERCPDIADEIISSMTDDYKTAALLSIKVLWDKDILLSYPDLIPKEKLKDYEKIHNTSLAQVTKRIMDSPKRLTSKRAGQIKTFCDPLLEKMTITYTGSNKNSGSYVLEIENFKTLFAKQVKNGANVFTYLLKKQNEQNSNPEITFMLSEFIGENAPYTSDDTAYRGLKSIFSKLTGIKVTGTTFKNGKEQAIKEGHIIAYYELYYNKPCKVSLLPVFRDKTFFTIIPEWAFSLPDKPFMLLDYIYYLARQKTADIRKTGSFNIGLDYVRHHLGLPDPKETVKKTEKILNPIEEAIETIEVEQHKRGKTDLKITPIYNLDYKTVEEYLQGYLKIELEPEATEYFIDRAKSKQKRTPKKAKTTDS